MRLSSTLVLATVCVAVSSPVFAARAGDDLIRSAYRAAPGQYAFHPIAEALYGVSVRPRGVTIVVASNGCTRKDHFRAEVRRGNGRPAILFRRMEPDNCRSFAAGDARFTYSWRELGLRPNPRVRVLNPITRDPAPSPLTPAG